MKKILSLLALMMLCITGANAEKVIYSWLDGTEQANAITLADGVTVAITGNTDKKIQNGSKITIGGTEYTSMKVSNGAQNTLTLPKEAVGITFYSYVNKDAATDRAPYWKEVAGVEYTEETSGGKMTSYKDGANPDVRSFSFAKTKEITFTNTGEQLCYVMEVEYAEEGTEPVEPVTDTKTIYLLPGVWDKDGARYAAWSWNGELGNWYDFTPNNIDGRLSVQVPATNTGFIAVRMNGGTEENNWDNAWNQTADIDLTNVADGSIITITGWGENDFTISTEEPVENEYTVKFENNGNWAQVYAYAWYAASDGTGLAQIFGDWPGKEITEKDDAGVYTLTFKSALEPTGIIFNNGAGIKTGDLVFENGKTYTFEETYTVAGAFYDIDGNQDASFFGEAWKVLEANDMTKNESGVWVKTWTDVKLAAGSISFKIVKNRAEWIEEDNSLPIDVEGTYDITIEYDGLTTTATATPKEVQPVTITAIALMGSSNEWAEPLATFKVEDASTGYWTLSDVQFAANDEFKVVVSYSDESSKWLAPESDGKFLVNEEQLDKELEVKENTPNMYVATAATLSFALNPAFTKLTITGQFEGQPVLNTYTAKFENNGNWAEVYAYAWKATVIGEGEVTTVDLLGAWPGTKIEPSDEGYVVTIKAAEAPDFIIFNNGAGLQTADLEFVDGATYSYDAPVEPIIPDGTYYVMNANEGTLINAESKLDAKGTPITFTFNATANAYTIEGAEFFQGKQWTIAEPYEGMSGFYTFSTVVDDKTLYVAIASTMDAVAPVLKDEAGDDAAWILLQQAYWEDIVNSTYTVAGTKNLTGTEEDWAIVEDNQMTYNEETALFEKKFKKIAVDGNNQPEFKVVKTNMEGVSTWYPEGDNWKITTDYVGGEGLYDITITFDPSDFKEIGVIATPRIVFPEDAIVFDFEAEQALIAAGTVSKPGNVGGSAANGQAFYGWEKADKTDSKRQDYKGYAKAEGSQLPDVCQVWRRSDRYDQDASWANEGGLTCPSNREYAIDGLKAGDKVIIVYEGVNNDQILWAIGDGTSGNEGVVRATATIDGVEAVTGETTIASGAEIVINSVTPAENGSGYFVFQVKKNMIISQIAVIPAPEPVETDYYLVGNMNDWTVSKDYMLVPNNGAPETEEYMFTLDLTTTSEFKIVKKDGETLIWYPEGEGNNYGQNGEITEDANYTVYFRPNYDGGEDWYYNCIYLVSNKEYEPIIPAGTYYVADMANDPLHFITDDGKLMCDGVPFEVTFDETTGTYGVQSNSIIGHYPLTIEEDAVYGHNISTTQNGVKVYLTANAMGTGVTFGTEPYAWALLPKEYVESDILSYTVAGTADLTGSDWALVDANKMTKNEETGLFEITFEGIEVNSSSMPQFKVVTRQYADGIVVDNTDVWYPASDESGDHNWVITPDVTGGEGKFDITIGFDTATKNITVTAKTSATGISSIYAEKLNGATIYNVNGQRVQNAQKGLYIINGRKVVVK